MGFKDAKRKKKIEKTKKKVTPRRDIERKGKKWDGKTINVRAVAFLFLFLKLRLKNGKIFFLKSAMKMKIKLVRE